MQVTVEKTKVKETVTTKQFGIVGRTYADVKMSFSRLYPEPKKETKY